jgi:hypothetical protein
MTRGSAFESTAGEGIVRGRGGDARRATTAVGVALVVMLGLAGCGRRDKSPAEGAGAPASATSSAPAAATSGRYTGNATAAPAVPERVVSATPPADFAGAKDVVLVNSDAAGCVGRQRDGWVQVTCEVETPARGRVIKAEMKEGFLGAAPARAPSADGRLQFELPWQAGKRGLAVIEFAKGTFEIATNNGGGRFRRMLPKPQAEACDEILRETSERLTKLRDAESGPVRGLDVKRFPKLGKCEISGDDAWALELADVRAAGESVEREVSLTLNVVHVDVNGKLAKAPWGPVLFAPAKLAISDASLFDYDGDQVSEVIVRYEVLARGEQSARKPQPKLPTVFTYKAKRVIAFQAAGTSGSGGTVAEQLEDDGRPDLGDYGPYVAWLGAGCGAGKCPERVEGPRFYRRSRPDGGFDGNAPEVTAALQRACSRNQGALVSDVETVGGKSRTALNVACARVRGETSEAVLTTLNQAKSQICGDAAECQLFSVLADWAKTEPPRKLVLPSKE